jgi:hypothetical protein
MATPVQTDKWAGNLECKFCGRTRMMAEAFSKTMWARGGSLKCKECVQMQEAETRSNAKGVDSDEKQVCTSCKKELEALLFNKSQWSKGEGLSWCKTCVDKALVQEAANIKKAQADKTVAAQHAVEDARKSGNSLAILKAESVLAVLEGEKVTGLCPIRMNSQGGGRQGGRGRAGQGSQ